MGLRHRIMSVVMAWQMRRMMKKVMQDMQEADAAYGGE
jgi:membrane peptidoglycan carboxypeptidase